MTGRISRLLGLAALSLTLALPAAARPPATSPAKLPDWSGAWTHATGGFYQDGPVRIDPSWPAHSVPGTPPYTPKFQAIYEDNVRRINANRYPDPISICGTPAGWPRMLATPDAYEFVVRPEETWILGENGPNVVRIYTDGRPHLSGDDLWNTYTGNNVGHWEGDTLVFDSIGLKGVGSVILGRGGVVMSDKLHVTTRIHLMAPDRLEIEMVLEDPVALTRPWPVTFTFTRLPKGSWLWDYACAENNRNPIAANGKTLTLGSDGKPIDKPD